MLARVLAAVLVVVLVPTPGQGQAALPPAGFQIMGGAGVGWTRTSCAFCRRDRDAGPVVYLQAMTRIRPGLTIGAEGNAWARDDEIFVLIGSIGAIAQMYPNLESPLYFKGGLSLVSYRAFDEEGDLVSNGPGIQLGAGYRFRVTDDITITNFINVLASRYGKLKEEDTVVVDNFGVTSFQLGIGLVR
jgi:hypothetical protein